MFQSLAIYRKPTEKRSRRQESVSLYFVNSATHSDCITFYTALRTIVLVFRICNRITRYRLSSLHLIHGSYKKRCIESDFRYTLYSTLILRNVTLVPFSVVLLSNDLKSFSFVVQRLRDLNCRLSKNWLLLCPFLRR